MTDLVKKLINPKLTPCFWEKASLYFFRISKIFVRSASLKVVNMAVSFFTDTNLSDTFLLNMDSFSLDSNLVSSIDEPIAGTTFKTSSLVIFSPLVFITLRSIPFSDAILLASGVTLIFSF